MPHPHFPHFRRAPGVGRLKEVAPAMGGKDLSTPHRCRMKCHGSWPTHWMCAPPVTAAGSAISPRAVLAESTICLVVLELSPSALHSHRVAASQEVRDLCMSWGNIWYCLHTLTGTGSAADAQSKSTSSLHKGAVQRSGVPRRGLCCFSSLLHPTGFSLEGISWHVAASREAPEEEPVQLQRLGNPPCSPWTSLKPSKTTLGYESLNQRIVQ